MANEITQAWNTASDNLYAIIVKMSDGEYYDVAAGGNTFEPYDNTDWNDYDLALTENGGVYSADFPSGITDSDIYHISVYQRAGGTPVLADDFLISHGILGWDGDGGDEIDITLIYTAQRGIQVRVDERDPVQRTEALLPNA